MFGYITLLGNIYTYDNLEKTIDEKSKSDELCSTIMYNEDLNGLTKTLKAGA